MVIIGLYLDNVMPTSPGLRKPFYFCLTRSFWRKNNRKVKVSMDHSMDEECVAERGEDFEMPNEALKKQEVERKMLSI
jgi:hypothetical protein